MCDTVLVVTCNRVLATWKSETVKVTQTQVVWRYVPSNCSLCLSFQCLDLLTEGGSNLGVTGEEAGMSTVPHCCGQRCRCTPDTSLRQPVKNHEMRREREKEVKDEWQEERQGLPAERRSGRVLGVREWVGFKWQQNWRRQSFTGAKSWMVQHGWTPNRLGWEDDTGQEKFCQRLHSLPTLRMGIVRGVKGRNVPALGFVARKSGWGSCAPDTRLNIGIIDLA